MLNVFNQKLYKMQLSLYIRHLLDYLVNLENNLKKQRDTSEETLEDKKKY